MADQGWALGWKRKKGSNVSRLRHTEHLTGFCTQPLNVTCAAGAIDNDRIREVKQCAAQGRPHTPPPLLGRFRQFCPHNQSAATPKSPIRGGL
jgi:hypothetical protein